jgi:hypothetical protein
MRASAALAKLIAFAELDSTRHRARKLGEAMVCEDGVGNTVRELEKLVERGRRT